MRVAVIGNYSKNLILFRGPLLRDLVRAGASATAVGPEENEVVAKQLRAWGIKFERIPLSRSSINPFSDILYMVRLWRFFRREQPELVLTFTHKPNTLGVIAAWLAGVRRIFFMVEGLGYAFIDVQGIRKRAANALLRVLYSVSVAFGGRAVFINPDDYRVFRDSKLINKEHRPIRLTGIGVDLARFSPTELPKPPFTFLMVSRRLRSKGLGEFLQAARVVKSRFENVRFSTLGVADAGADAFPERELRAYAEEGVVEVLDELDDVRPVYRECHCYVLPSYREGLPMTVMEAMAMRRPIITTDVPGCRETISCLTGASHTGGIVQGENGYLVPPKDVAGLVEAMSQLLSRPDALCELADKSRQLAEAKFDSRKINRELLAALGIDGKR